MSARRSVRVAPPKNPKSDLNLTRLTLMITAFLIFLLTLTLVIWQPRGLGIGWSASLGAILALLFGVISFADIPLVWHIVWNATGTFIAIIVTSLILDQAGFFEWSALHVAR